MFKANFKKGNSRKTENNYFCYSDSFICNTNRGWLVLYPI